MNPALLLLVFTAFLLGAAFASLIILALSGGQPKSARPFVFGAAGAAFGAIALVVTQSMWESIVVPYAVCPVIATAAALVAYNRH